MEKRTRESLEKEIEDRKEHHQIVLFERDEYQELYLEALKENMRLKYKDERKK